jgi:hypothetical protein
MELFLTLVFRIDTGVFRIYGKSPHKEISFPLGEMVPIFPVDQDHIFGAGDFDFKGGVLPPGRSPLRGAMSCVRISAKKLKL